MSTDVGGKVEAAPSTQTAPLKAASGRRLRLLGLPLLVALLAYLFIGASAGTKLGKTGDPSVFIVPGEQFAKPELLPPDTYVYPESGYDGQLFFYLAQDPLLTGKVATRDQIISPHLGHVAYRYQRILLPALGWLTSWGNTSVLEWTLPLINLLAVLGAGFLLARFLAARGASPWLSLVYMLSIGVSVGVVFDLADPLAASLFVAGVVWWLEGKPWAAIAALTACLLARELYLIPVLVIVGLELARHRRYALQWLIPLAVFGAWQVYLRLALASPVTPDTAERPSIVPLLGAYRKLREVLESDWLGAANWEVLFVGLLLLIPALFLVRSAGTVAEGLRSRSLPPRDRLLPVVALASVVTVPFLTVALWGYIPSYARYSAPAAGMLVLLYAVTRDRAARYLMIGLMALTLTNPVVALFPISHGTAVEVPPPPEG
jgi:hypothetical protein